MGLGQNEDVLSVTLVFIGLLNQISCLENLCEHKGSKMI